MAKDIAPAPRFPEAPGYVYERKVAPPTANYNADRKGPLRFEEGLGSDTAVPRDFQVGVTQGLATPPGRPNHNMNVFEKPAAETMQERAHPGSASWVEAPELLSEFAGGAFVDYSAPEYIQDLRDGGNQRRRNPASVSD